MDLFYFERALFVLGDCLNRLSEYKDKVSSIVTKIYKKALRTNEPIKKIALIQFVLQFKQHLILKRQTKVALIVNGAFQLFDNNHKILLLRNIFSFLPTLSAISPTQLIPHLSAPFELCYLTLTLLNQYDHAAVTKDDVARIKMLLCSNDKRVIVLVFRLLGKLCRQPTLSKEIIETFVSYLRSQQNTLVNLTIEQLALVSAKDSKSGRLIVLYCIKSFTKSSNAAAKSQIIEVVRRNFTLIPNVVIDFLRKTATKLNDEQLEVKTAVIA